MTGQVICAQDGPVARLTFDNPGKLNAVSLAMWEQLAQHCATLARDGAVRVVVLQGAGERAFVSGADISEFGEARTGEDAVARYNAAVATAEQALAALPMPTVAAIRGYCIGGGLSIALRCDLRIAAADARFAIPAARLGLGYGAEGIAVLARLVGPSVAAEMLFTARRFAAEEALRVGLASRVVPTEDWAGAVEETAATIAGNAPLTLRAAKAALQDLARPEAERDTERLAALVRACYGSDDYREGKAAFAEKRPPMFRGH